MPARHRDPRVARVVAFFETLAPADLARLGEVYADDARFKDPFNAVHGLPAIRRVFEHMFAALEEPRFVVRDAVAEGDLAFVTWDFVFRSPRLTGVQVIQGASELRFAADGRIAAHIDHWDAAEGLYEKLPLVGALMRWLKRRAAS